MALVRVKMALPKKTRLVLYCEQLAQVLSEALRTKDNAIFFSFLNNLFCDCREFLKAQTGRSSPCIFLQHVQTHEEYERLQQENRQHAQEDEVPIGSSYSFCVVSPSGCRIYIDMKPLFDIFAKGFIDAFIKSVVADYIHELIHCLFNREKSEQEAYDLECAMIEKFLEIELPKKAKKIRASDYYRKKN